MSQKYQVNLSLEERSLLFGLIAKGEGPTRKITHARILLKADGSQPDRWTDKAISIALDML